MICAFCFMFLGMISVYPDEQSIYVGISAFLLDFVFGVTFVPFILPVS